MTKRSKELENRILDELKKGLTLRQVCRMSDEFPDPSAVIQWACDDDVFSQQYADARKIGYMQMADECFDIADDGTNDWVKRKNKSGDEYEEFNNEHYQRSRLRLDTRKWFLSKCLPKIYGDKLALTDADGGPLQISVVKFSDEPKS